MAYRHSNGGVGAGGGGGTNVQIMGVEYSGDERESRSGGEDYPSNLDEKPVYLLEHLATFTVNKDSGIIYPADGMRRLLQLEKTTGIWSQKMQLCLDHQWVLIMDYETGNIIERFPATLIQEPTAFTSTDAMELYNNILVFIVSGGAESRSEMHIFQSQSVSAVHLVEDLKSLRAGKLIMQQHEISQQQYHQQQLNISGADPNKSSGNGVQGRSEQHEHQRNRFEQYGTRSDIHLNSTAIGETDSDHGGNNDETSSTSSDKYERDVTVLNHCFDDIEKFIARLQHAAAASRELERRRRNRKTKKKDPGEGLLTLRTRPPHEKEFIDIFAKFKLSFNLLAKLKAHIHDPNAPELVHFLFTPLALIVEAASDTYYESQLPGRVVNPLLTREAVNLLINCVTSKETELWRSLGDAWIIPRDQWKEDIGSYHPVFLDGWSPDYLVVDELEPTNQSAISTTNMSKRQLESQNHHRSNNNAISSNYDDYDGNERYPIHHGNILNERSDRVPLSGVIDFSTRSDISIDSIERSGLGGQSISLANNNTGGIEQNIPTIQAITAGVQNLHAREGRNSNSGNNGGDGGAYGGMQPEIIALQSGAITDANISDDHVLEAWLDDIQAAGAKIVLVTYPRTANNDKELSVVRGEYLEILDDTRKWWKARNIRGQVAHVPHTIVTPYNYNDIEGNSQYCSPSQHQQHHYKTRQTPNSITGDNTEENSPEATHWNRNKHLGKKGEFRYF